MKGPFFKCNLQKPGKVILITITTEASEQEILGFSVSLPEKWIENTTPENSESSRSLLLSVNGLTSKLLWEHKLVIEYILSKPKKPKRKNNGGIGFWELHRSAHFRCLWLFIMIIIFRRNMERRILNRFSWTINLIQFQLNVDFEMKSSVFNNS